MQYFRNTSIATAVIVFHCYGYNEQLIKPVRIVWWRPGVSIESFSILYNFPQVLKADVLEGFTIRIYDIYGFLFFSTEICGWHLLGKVVIRKPLRGLPS